MTSFRNWVDIEHSSVSKNFKYVWKPNIRPFWLPHKLANWYVHFQEAKPQSLSNWCFWNTEFYYIFAQMVHTTLVPNLLRKATRSMTIKISAKKNGTTTGSTKSYPLHQKLHQQVLLINASSMYHYMPKILVLSDTLKRILCREKHFHKQI